MCIGEANGIKFVIMKSKQVCNDCAFDTNSSHSYRNIESLAVNIVEDSITMNMHTTGAGEQKNFNFDTNMKNELLLIS